MSTCQKRCGDCSLSTTIRCHLTFPKGDGWMDGWMDGWINDYYYYHTILPWKSTGFYMNNFKSKVLCKRTGFLSSLRRSDLRQLSLKFHYPLWKLSFIQKLNFLRQKKTSTQHTHIWKYYIKLWLDGMQGYIQGWHVEERMCHVTADEFTSLNYYF